MEDHLIKTFYDKHSRTKFMKNFIRGNRRIERQKWYLSGIVPPNARTILVIGCASGEVCHWLRRRVCRRARILGVDISPDYIALANRMFAHPAIEYRVANVLEDVPEGPWDVILFPDVFEHLPKAERGALIRNLAAVCGGNTKIIMTCPTPAHQRLLIERGWGLQPVDELITLEDFQEVARGLNLEVTNFMSVHVHRRLDYNYVVLESVPEVCCDLSSSDKVPLRSWPERNLYRRLRRGIHRVYPLRRLQMKYKEWYLHSLLSGVGSIRRWSLPVILVTALFALVATSMSLQYQREAQTDASDLDRIVGIYEARRGMLSSEVFLIDELPSGYQRYFRGKVTYLDDDDITSIISEIIDGESDYFIVEDSSATGFEHLGGKELITRVADVGDFILYEERGG